MKKRALHVEVVKLEMQQNARAFGHKGRHCKMSSSTQALPLTWMFLTRTIFCCALHVWKANSEKTASGHFAEIVSDNDLTNQAQAYPNDLSTKQRRKKTSRDQLLASLWQHLIRSVNQSWIDKERESEANGEKVSVRWAQWHIISPGHQHTVSPLFTFTMECE